MAGNDCRLDIATAVQHVAKNFLQARERGFAGDVVGRAYFLGRDQTEGAAYGFRRVMERGLQRDLGVVQAAGIELNLGSAGAASEEVYGAAFADHLDGPLPGFGTSHGLDHYIATAFLRGQGGYRVDYVLYLGDLHNFVRAHVLGGHDLLVAFDDGDHVTTDGAGYLD